MKLIEEKKLMILSVLAIGIVLTTMLIQYSDSQINEYNKQLFIKQNTMNEKLAQANHALEIFHQYVLYEGYNYYGIMNISLDLSMDNLEAFASSQKIAIYQAYNNGDITMTEAISQLKEVQHVDYNNKLIEYLTADTELNELLEEGAPWQNWKTIFVILQVILVILSLIGYISLYKEIRDRSDKKREDK